MTAKILIPFDETECAQNTVTYVGENLNKDDEVTLFHVVPNTAAACGLNSPSLTPYFEKERNSFCRMEEKREKVIRDTLEAARNKLINAGFAKDKVYIKTQPQGKKISDDIIHEAQKGKYNTVAMGRSSTSGLKEFFIGSNASRVMHTLNIPVVIVD
ncbi:universal stress protein [Desulfobacter hydrogenophilus]|uniref:Universal stress protein n=1 Tax=Desulfobacter hydrogenophilus TaxID=2291 RepID=A0A328F9Y3_9BACT|nr:universal stress protein [Desulfobacter hydrogenophilus]NDY73752.1 universal stress protein [Desulfobacter hydrogenophilus]QBH13386.1 universal stress protein [Desulfobacter hydrogenophilus]RAM00490.1 universal stress protein [Desulfobacter hydrogenophilus]